MKISIKKMKTVLVAGMSLSVLALVILFQTGSQAASMTTSDGGGETFKAKCVACHGADGTGNTTVGKSLKIPNLTSAAVQGKTDAQLYSIVAQGKGKMPGYAKTLGADKCKELVAFVRTLKK